MAKFDTDYRDRIQHAAMAAIIEQSIMEADGVRTAALRSAEIVDALNMIVTTMLATSAEAQTEPGRKRLLRAQARHAEKRMILFQAHTRQHGNPFTVQREQ